MKWNFLKNRKKTLSKTATSQDQQWPAINSSAERIRNDIGNQIREGHLDHLQVLVSQSKRFMVLRG